MSDEALVIKINRGQEMNSQLLISRHNTWRINPKPGYYREAFSLGWQNLMGKVFAQKHHLGVIGLADVNFALRFLAGVNN